MANAISNVEVERVNGGDYCLGWYTKDARYHVWLAPQNYEARPVMGQYRKQIYKHDLTPKSKCHFLSMLIPKNKLMFDDAMAQAVAAHLFEKCDERIAKQEHERQAEVGQAPGAARERGRARSHRQLGGTKDQPHHSIPAR